MLKGDLSNIAAKEIIIDGKALYSKVFGREPLYYTKFQRKLRELANIFNVTIFSEYPFSWVTEELLDSDNIPYNGFLKMSISELNKRLRATNERIITDENRRNNFVKVILITYNIDDIISSLGGTCEY